MLLSLVLFESEFLNIVSISFSALVVNELAMVAVEITTWHLAMVVSEVLTLALYVVSILFLPEYFGASPFTRRGTPETHALTLVLSQTFPSSRHRPSSRKSP